MPGSVRRPCYSAFASLFRARVYPGSWSLLREPGGAAASFKHVFFVWWEVRQQFLSLLTDRVGDRGGSAEQSARKGYYAVVEDAPKLKGSSLWSPKPDFYLWVGLPFRESFRGPLDSWVVMELAHRTTLVCSVVASVLCHDSSSLTGGANVSPVLK